MYVCVYKYMYVEIETEISIIDERYKSELACFEIGENEDERERLLYYYYTHKADVLKNKTLATLS